MAGGTLTLDGTTPATTIPTVRSAAPAPSPAPATAVTNFNAYGGALTGDHTTTAAT